MRCVKVDEYEILIYNADVSFAPCKVSRIPESRKFLLVKSRILGIGIQNQAFGIQIPAKE